MNINSNKRTVHRGEVYWIHVPKDVEGSEQGGDRLGVVIQNDVGNKFAPTTIVAFITSGQKNNLATHTHVELMKPSTIMCEQVRTLAKSRLDNCVYTLTDEEMRELDYAVMVSMGLVPVPPRYSMDYEMEDGENE